MTKCPNCHRKLSNTLELRHSWDLNYPDGCKYCFGPFKEAMWLIVVIIYVGIYFLIDKLKNFKKVIANN